MTQPSLFSDFPGSSLAHSSDPPTSHQAAAGMIRSGKLGRHEELVLALVQACPGLTAVELWSAAGDDVKAELHEMQEVRRRLTGLRQAGRVRQGPARECGVRRTKMVTWLAV